MSKTRNVKGAAAIAGAAPCSAKPCEIPCPKCGGTDIYREHRGFGESVDKLDLDDDCKTIPPYLKSDWPYGYKVTKEHIGHTCRVCSFHWRTDILPNDKLTDAAVSDAGKQK